jgi:hypothetical protein
MSKRARNIPWKTCPVKDRLVTLGCVKEGVITFAQSAGDKQGMLNGAREAMTNGTVYFLAWTGKWTTDIFKVTEEDIDQMLIILN